MNKPQTIFNSIYRKKQFCPDHEFIAKATKEFLRKGGKITRIDSSCDTSYAECNFAESFTIDKEALY